MASSAYASPRTAPRLIVAKQAQHVACGGRIAASVPKPMVDTRSRRQASVADPSRRTRLGTASKMLQCSKKALQSLKTVVT